MSGRHPSSPDAGSDDDDRPDPVFRPVAASLRRRRRRQSRLRLVALWLVPLLVLSVLAVVVVDRVRDPDLVPIAEQNPFRDLDLPESSNGTAEGREHEVPTEQTQAVDAPGPAAVDAKVEDPPGSVPTTVTEPVVFADEQGQEEPAAVEEPEASAIGLAEAPAAETREAPPSVADPDEPQDGRTEVEELATETTKVFENPDGTFTSEISSSPVQFQDDQGDWVDIDTDLVEVEGDRLRPEATEVDTELASVANDAQIVKLETDDGLSVGFGIEGAAAAPGTVDTSVVTYSDVREATDLTLTATPDGVKDVLTLASPDAPTTWTFPLTLDGLIAEIVDGQVHLTDDEGELRALIPTGWMADSGTGGPAGGPAESYDVDYSLITLDSGQQALRMELDEAWLAAPDRVYPVKVDPAFVEVLDTWHNDTYVSSTHPEPHGAADVLRAGVYLNDVNYSYVQFGGQNDFLTGATILNANVNLFNSKSASSSCTPYPVYLHEVLISWDGITMPWPGAPVGGVVAENTFTHSDIPSCPGGWATFSDPRLTQLANDWSHGVKTNTGLSVRTSTTNGQHFKEFESYNCNTPCNPANPATDLRPRMTVTWTPYDATYAWPSGGPAWQQTLTDTQAGRIGVAVTNKGQSAWPVNGNYKLAYRVYDATGTTLIQPQGYATNMPQQVDVGETVTVDATINPLPPGNYIIVWDMQDWGTPGGPTWFSDHLIQPFPTSISSASGNLSGPVVTGATPLSGEPVSSLMPTLSVTGFDPDSTPGGLKYSYQICTGADANSGFCWNSGAPQAATTWRPPAGALVWNQNYYWRGKLTDGGGLDSQWTAPIRLFTQPPTPPTSGHFGRDPYAPAVGNVTPLVQNYATSTTDATVSGAGPSLSVTRTYNSRNDQIGLFGSGWTSEWDMAATYDPNGEGGLLVTNSDGRQGRFGRNWDGTYSSQDGYYSQVQAPSAQVASFTAANSATSLGLADTGQAWQPLDGTWGIVNNDAYLVSGSIWQRNAAVMPAAADGTVQFTAPVAQDGIGVAVRVQDIDNMWMLYLKPSTNSLVLSKRVAGWETQVATIPNACCAAGDTYAVTTAGDQFTVLRNNRVVGTATDAQFNTAARAGVYVASTGTGRIGSIVMVDGQHRDLVGRANSATSAGVTDSGEAWAPHTGTWGVNGNSLYLAAAAGTRNVATVAGATDGAFSFKLPTAQAGLGLAFRYADPSNYWRLVAQPGSGTWQLVKRVAGVETTAAQATGQCCTASDTMRVETSGPSIKVFRNGTEIMSVNDVAVLNGSRVGPFAEATGAGRVDDLLLTAATVMTDKTGTSHAFRSDGRLTGVTDVAGRRLAFTYDGNARLTSVQNVTTGRSLTVTWSGNHVSQVSTASVAAHSGPLTWSYGYDGDKLTTVTAPHSGTPTTYAYAFNGKLGQITLPRGNIDTTIGYNLDGTVAWREDGRGKRTTYVNLGGSTTRTVRVTDPRGHAEDWEYSDGQLISHRDGTGDRRFAYNDRGFLTSVTDENGNAVTMATDDRGNVLRRTTTRTVNGNSPATYTEYYSYFAGPPGDPRNDLVTEFRDGRSASASDDEFRTAYSYSPFGDVTQVRTPSTPDFPSGRTENWTYSAGTEPAFGGGTVPRGLLLSYTDARGKVTTYEYGSNGDLRRDTDPVSLVHEYTYDELGRRLTAKEVSDPFPSGLTTSYTYSPLSRVVQTTEPGVLNPITSVTHTARTTNTFDANGNITQVVVSDTTGGDPSRATTFGYDNADQPTSVTVGAGSPIAATTSTTYDDNGNVATTTDPAGTVTSFTWTAKNLLATTTVEDFVDDPVANTTPRDVVVESRAYDPAGRLASVTDAEGRTVEYEYWLDDLPRREVLVGYRPPDLTNGVLSGPGARDVVLAEYAYDGAGNPVSTTTGGGATTVVAEVDAANRVTSTSLDPAGLDRTATYTYDAVNNVTASELSAAGTLATARVEASYDDASRTTSETVFGDGLARFVTSVTRDDRGFVTSSADPRGYVFLGAPNPAFVTNTSVNAAGLTSQVLAPPVQVEENGGAATSHRPSGDLGYNTFGELTHSRDARSLVTTTTYDVLGRPTQTSYPAYTPPGGSPVTPTESWTYDAVGNLLTSTDTRGEVTSAVYDKLGRVVAVTEPQVGSSAAGVSRFLYDDVGNLVTTVDVLGVWTFFAYDDLDRVWATAETERSPMAVFVTYTDHDDAGHVNRVLNPVNTPSGASWTAEYNAAGELVEERDEADNLTAYAYNPMGQLAEVTDPLGRSTRITYDRAGRAVGAAQLSPADVQLRSVSTAYDAAGNAVSSTDASGWTTTRTYDALDQLRTLVEPVDASTSITTSFGYDKAGHRTRLTDGRGNVTTTTFNTLGLVEDVVEPSTAAYPAVADRRWRTSYDTGGLPVSEVAPGGVTRTRTFDELGRLTAESGAGGGAGSASRSLGYDLAGRLTSVDHPWGAQNVTYNDRNLVTGTSGDGGATSFDYDANGRMTSRSDPGTFSNFGYDAQGELTSVSGTATNDTRTLAYDDAGQLTSVTYANPQTVRSFGYDDLGRTVSDSLSGPGGVLRSQTYAYDANDNRTSTTVGPSGVAGAGTQSYSYDRADRLVSWTDQASVVTAYGWDAAGNRISAGGAAAVFDARNRLTSDGTATYSYTARGTLSTRVEGATTATTVFDSFDRLVADNTGGVTTYAYDGLDRLAVRNGSRLVYGGMEKEPSVEEGIAAYSRDPDGDLTAVGSSAGDLATLSDGHGDVVAAFSTDGAGLAVARSFDPFGKPLSSSGGSLAVGFQGSWTDPTTSKVSAQARWYSPGTGSFVSRDRAGLPVSGSVSANRYVYANANPLVFNDPSGFAGCTNDGCKFTGRSKSAGQVTKSSAGGYERPLVRGTKSTTSGGGSGAGGAGGGASVPVVAGPVVSGGGARPAGPVAAPVPSPAVAPVPAPSRSASTVRPVAPPVTSPYVSNRPGTVTGALPVTPGPAPGSGPVSVPYVAPQYVAPQYVAPPVFVEPELPAAPPPAPQAPAGCVASGGVQALVDTCTPARPGTMLVQPATLGPPPMMPAKPGIVGIPSNPALDTSKAQDFLEQFLDRGWDWWRDRRQQQREERERREEEEEGQAAADHQLYLDATAELDAAAAEEFRQEVACRTGNSFDGATRVLMADGSSRPISEVEVGDLVLATDPETGRTEARAVTDLIVGEGLKTMVAVTVDTAGPDDGVLLATDGHPFWDAADREWVDAADLTTADQLQAADGKTLPVAGTLTSVHVQTVYNFTVADIHTYYVLAGEASVLVHNANGCGDLGSGWRSRPASEVCDSSGCEDVARDIQRRIGGEIFIIKPAPGLSNLGRYRGQWSGWGEHHVVVRDGRVYDAFTGRTGLPIDEYKALWDDMFPEEFPF